MNPQIRIMTLPYLVLGMNRAPFHVRLLPCNTWAPGYRRRLASFPSQNVGGRIADLVWQWLHTIQWPDGPSAPHDWGISWLELLFNFYLCTGQRFPVRIDTVQGRKTQIQQYVPYDSNEAVARPCYIERWKSRFLA